MIDPWISDWLHLLVRWMHLVFGAAWIGASFYFNWLNNHVRPVDDPTGRLAGSLWSVHGGAFYQVSKYKGAPEKLPDVLHWFKYEAYFTWITGVILLVLVYWLQAESMMLPAGSTLHPHAAMGIGVASLAVGWVVYDLLCRSPLVRRPAWLGGLLFALMTLAAWGLSQVLSSRAAYMHVGAMMGTMMALNVFFVIIPGQRAMVDAMTRGEQPDVSRGQAGALRSRHNNYFTLPVLFIMISIHFPFTYGHVMSWAVLAAISLIGAGVRHWFNLRGMGHVNTWLLPAAAVAMVALAFVSHGPRESVDVADAPPFEEIQQIVTERCVTCHATKPTFAAYPEPPLGLVLETPESIRFNAAKIHTQVVATHIMPLGNLTQMTLEERETLGRWIAAGAPLP
jgi:uncharacterized membrane protein